MVKPVMLTVDDDREVSRAIERDLRRKYGSDYRVLRAESGNAAIDIVRELKVRNNSIALFLVDQRMPGISGVEFLEQAITLFPDPKRVLLTAYADTDAAIAAINDAGVDHYLLKPWDPPEENLYPVLDDLLEDWQATVPPEFEGIRVLGNRWSPESHNVKDFLARNHIPYQWLDIETAETDTDIRDLVDLLDDHEKRNLPLVIFPDGLRVQRPTLAAVAEKIGLQTRAAQAFYDLAIVGGGPAGLAAAVYGASEGLRTVMVEREAPGGQAGTSSRIENYLGFPSGLSGGDLARRAVTQARRFNVEILSPQEICELRCEGQYKVLRCGGNGKEINTKALMLATGVRWRKLPTPNAEQFEGRGLYYGAAMTEAQGMEGEDVYVVGAGNSAGQAAVFFSEHAARVIMMVRGKTLGEKMSQYLVDRLESLPNVVIKLQADVTECHGDEHLEAITIRNRATNETEQVRTRCLFVFIGADPNTAWLNSHIALDDHGFILTGSDIKPDHLKDWPLAREPYLLEASVPGVFAAGDVRHESIKRVASAVGEGSVAVHFVHRYLASL